MSKPAKGVSQDESQNNSARLFVPGGPGARIRAETTPGKNRYPRVVGAAGAHAAHRPQSRLRRNEGRGHGRPGPEPRREMGDQLRVDHGRAGLGRAGRPDRLRDAAFRTGPRVRGLRLPAPIHPGRPQVRDQGHLLPEHALVLLRLRREAPGLGAAHEHGRSLRTQEPALRQRHDALRQLPLARLGLQHDPRGDEDGDRRRVPGRPRRLSRLLLLRIMPAAVSEGIRKPHSQGGLDEPAVAHVHRFPRGLDGQVPGGRPGGDAGDQPQRGHLPQRRELESREAGGRPGTSRT